jgi:hypothetical protein
MKIKPAALIILTVALSIGVQAQQSKRTISPKPPDVDRLPSLTTPPTFPASEAGRSDKTTSITAAKLPVVQQEKVYSNLNEAFERAKNIRTFQGSLASKLELAKADYENLLGRRDKPIPNLLLWTLNGDAELVRHYARTGQAKYAIAAFNHLRSLASAGVQGEANVTVVTVNGKGKPEGGYQICYLPAEWVDLNISPTVFPSPSDSSETLPKANWAFWSRDFQDQKREGHRTTKFIDKDQNLSIGIPR